MCLQNRSVSTGSSGVGSAHAGMAMRTDYCEQLKQIHDELGIERVRFHGIFSDDMHTYDTMTTVMPMPGSEQVPFYENSFRLPGLVYDNVLKAGMKPFVELSFMPSQLAKRPTRGSFYWKPCIAPPKDEAPVAGVHSEICSLPAEPLRQGGSGNMVL